MIRSGDPAGSAEDDIEDSFAIQALPLHLHVSKVAKQGFKAEVLMHDAKLLDSFSGTTVDAAGNVYTGSRKSKKIY